MGSPFKNLFSTNFEQKIYQILRDDVSTSRKYKKVIYLPNIMKTIFLNSKQPVGGVCKSQDWYKKQSPKSYFFIK